MVSQLYSRKISPSGIKFEENFFTYTFPNIFSTKSGF